MSVWKRDRLVDRHTSVLPLDCPVARRRFALAGRGVGKRGVVERYARGHQCHPR
jgi:hypothetical protein